MAMLLLLNQQEGAQFWPFVNIKGVGAKLIIGKVWDKLCVIDSMRFKI